MLKKSSSENYFINSVWLNSLLKFRKPINKNINNNNKNGIKKNIIISPKKELKPIINQITEKVYLGSLKAAENYEYLLNNKIFNILSLTPETPKFPSTKLNQKIINIDDFSNQNIIQYFYECIEFIEKSNKVFVHCNKGISRSATIVIAYLMWKNHFNYIDSYFYVKNKRNFISPNEGFIQQLKIFERLLKDNNYDLNKINFNNIIWKPQKFIFI